MAWRISLRRAWQRLKEPSLLRGLLVAQATLVSLLWVGLVLVSVLDEATERQLAQSEPVMRAILMTAQALDDRPEALRQVLAQIEQTNQAEAEDAAAAIMGMLLRKGDERIYASPSLPAAVRGQHPAGLSETEVEGRHWVVFTVLTPPAAPAMPGLSLSFVQPRPSHPLEASLGLLGSLVQPLLISLPLLVLPAWLSVRWALRPWRRLSADVARRDAQDLSPLTAPSQDQELRPLVLALNRLLAQLREARVRERRFVADAAHELRTPLTALGVYAESMQKQALQPQAQTLLTGMLRSKERAVRLVNQLLALMRSEAEAQGALESVDLATFVPECLAELEPLAQARGVTLECEVTEGALRLMARPEGLHALFTNLVENAIKYGPQGGCVRLRLWRQGGSLLASVADQGPGIAPEWRDAALARFTRLPGQSQPGSGLGLAIASSVMLAQGGELQLQDAPGGGLLVCLRWPSEASLNGDAGPGSA